MHSRWTRGGVVVLAALLLAGSAQAATTIKMVPPTGGTTSSATGVSSDGTIVVGGSNNEVLRFDVAAGASSSLGRPSGWSAAGAGPNGVTIQGGSLYISGSGTTAGGATHGFWYEQSSGTWKDMGDLSGGADDSVGNGISWNGNYVAGTSEDQYDPCAVRFNAAANSLLALTRPDNRTARGYGFDVNYDGFFVCGWGDGTGKVAGFYWIASDSKTHNLPSLPGAAIKRWHALAMSADGQWVVGASCHAGSGANGSGETFLNGVRWRVSPVVGPPSSINVLETLDLGTGFTYGRFYAQAVSDYGHVVAGWHREANANGAWIGPQTACIWDAVNGTQDLKVALTNLGVDMSRWVLLSAVNSVSSDGRVLAGNGTYDEDGDPGTTTDQYARGWVVTDWPAPTPPPSPPVIGEVSPDPESVVPGQSYTKQLRIIAGVPGFTWSVVQGPPGLTVSANGLVSGWTPMAADVGSSVTIEIRADNADGFDTETWQVNVVAPSAPAVKPALLEGSDSVTVTGLYSFAELVTLYQNGSPLTSIVPSGGVSEVTFTGLSPLVVGDYYTATQTTGGYESAQSFRRRCVQPLTVDLTHLDPGFEGTALDDCWHVGGGSPVLSTEQAHSGSQSMKETGTSEGGTLAQIWADMTPTAPAASSAVVYTFWLYHTPGDVNELHFGRIFDYVGQGFGDGVSRWIFSIGPWSSVTAGTFDPTVYQGRWEKFNAAGQRTNDYLFNLNEGGLGARRSAGWHRMEIKFWKTTEFGTTGKIYWYVDGKYGNDGDTTFDMSNMTLDSLDVGNKNPAASDGRSAYYDDVWVSQVSNQSPYLILTPINATEGQAITPTDQLGQDDDDPETVTLTVLNPEAMPAGLTLSATSARGKPAVITVSGTPGAGTSTGGDGSGTYMIDLRATDDLGAESLDTLFIKVAPPSGCAAVPQDADKDGDVDVNDFAVFQACFNGPGMPWPPPPVPQDKCACLDQDDDGDVDVNDFAVFQTCFNGASNPPGC